MTRVVHLGVVGGGGVGLVRLYALNQALVFRGKSARID